MAYKTPLDVLPLDLLLALQDAIADPTADGQERARMAAQEAGIYIFCTCRPDGSEGVDDPLPMPSGEGVYEVTAELSFS